MFSHIMMATDFSPSAMIATTVARDLARKFASEVTLAHVTAGTSSEQDDARDILEGLGAERFGGDANVEVVERDRAPFALCEVAKKVGADLVIMGRHGQHKLTERLVGSTTERVARHAPCSVLSVHPAMREPVATLRSIVVGTDLSNHALTATRIGAEFARRFEARVTLAHVYDLFPAVEMLQEPYDLGADTTLEAALTKKLEQVQSAEFDGVRGEARVLRDKSTVNALCNLASDVEAGLMVVGTHGHAGIERFLLGSVAEAVIRHAPCSTLVTR